MSRPVNQPASFVAVLSRPAIMPAGRWSAINYMSPIAGAKPGEILSIPALRAVTALIDGSAQVQYLPADPKRQSAFVTRTRITLSQQLVSAYRCADHTMVHSGVLPQPPETVLAMLVALLARKPAGPAGTAFAALLDGVAGGAEQTVLDDLAISASAAVVRELPAELALSDMSWLCAADPENDPDLEEARSAELIDITDLFASADAYAAYAAGSGGPAPLLSQQRDKAIGAKSFGPSLARLALSERRAAVAVQRRLNGPVNERQSAVAVQRRPSATVDPNSLPPLRVVEDLGRVAGGASGGHRVRCENGSEYLLKGWGLNKAMPFIGANELLAARLARRLDLPILGHDAAELDGHIYFASAWMDERSFVPLTAAGLARCSNRDRIYDVAAFDVWIANQDRHDGNLLVRSGKADGSLLLLNDHSHTFGGPSGNSLETALKGTLGVPAGQCLISSTLMDALDDSDSFSEAITAVEALSADVIAYEVESLPKGLLPKGDTKPYLDFLLHRQAKLRRLISEAYLVGRRMPRLKAQPAAAA